MALKPSTLPAIDWDDLRYFLHLVREGSLSGAARQLGTTQPTMSRRLDLFEQKLGAVLFERMPSGLKLTETGRQILDHAAQMEEAALAAQRIAVGSHAGLTGTVRVTASEWLGSRVLSPMLAAFCTDNPAVTVELVTDAEPLSLTRREIDVALRFGRFEQDDLMQRKIGQLPFGLYAAAAYPKNRGLPDFSRGGDGAALITMNGRLVDSVAETKWLRRHLPHAHVAFCSNSRDGQAVAAAAGAGLVCLPLRLAVHYPDLQQLTTPAPLPGRELWLGLHRDTRKVLRIRSLVDFLVERFRQAD